jgi:hypothetical protein
MLCWICVHAHGRHCLLWLWWSLSTSFECRRWNQWWNASEKWHFA